MPRTLKIIAWSAGGLMTLMIVLGGALFFGANTHRGREIVEQLASRYTHGQVKLTGLTGEIPQHLMITQLELRDAQGIWLRAERIELSWSPLALLSHWQIDNLRVAGVELDRLPERDSRAGSKSISIPHIDVARLSVQQLRLGASLAGVEASLAMQGRAHLRTLDDLVIALDARRIDGNGQYRLHLSVQPQRVDAALILREPDGGPLQHMLKLPNLGALAVTVNVTGQRAAEQLEASLQAGMLQGHAQGSIDFKKGSADLNFAVDSSAMSPRPGLGWSRAILSGRWLGSIRSAAALGHLEVRELRVPGELFLANLDADAAVNDRDATVRARLGGLRIPGPRPELLEEDAIKVDASTRLDDLAHRLDLTASHPLFELHAQTAAAASNATLQLHLPNLLPLAQLLGQNEAGQADLQARLAGTRALAHLDLKGTADLRGGEAWSAFVGKRATLQLSATLNDRTLAIEDIRATGAGLSVSGKGTIVDKIVDGHWQLAFSDLSRLSARFAGTLRASGSVHGSTHALDGSASIISTLSLGGAPPEALSAQVNLRGWPTNPSGALVAHGSLDGAPLDVEMAMNRKPTGAFHAAVSRADWKSAHVEGDLSIDPADQRTSGHLNGQLTMSISQLRDLQPLLGVEIAGSITGALELRPTGQKTNAHLVLDARDISLSGLLGTVHVSGDGFTDAFNFDAGAQVPNLQGAPAGFSAKGHLNFVGREISLASARLAYRGQNMRLLSPARLTFVNGLSVDSLKLGAQKAELAVQGEFAPALSIHAALNHLQPSLVNAFIPGLLATGEIDASADLHGSAALPEGEVRLHAAGIRLGTSVAFGMPPADLWLVGLLKAAGADIELRFDAGGASQLTAIGQVPLAWGGSLAVKLNGGLDVGLINPLLEGRGQHINGHLGIDVAVEGTPLAPLFSGTIDLTKGGFRDYVHGISVSDLMGQVSGGKGELQIKSLSATAAPGTLSMSGSVGIRRPGFPVKLKITARDAQPLVSKLVTANFDADIDVSGNAAERLEIAGDVNLHRVVIGIPNSLPPDVAVLDVRRRGKPSTRPLRKPLAVGLDVRVEAPKEILVQGRGLDAELGGSLVVRGTLAAPAIDGGFDLLRGSFSLASNKLLLTPPGRLSFDSAVLKSKIDPTLDFTAQATLSDNTIATLHIGGFADAPKFSITSVPVLPPDQVMALLLFGAPANTLSAFQLAQAGMALASLSGVRSNGSLNALARIQKSLGLDRLTIGADAATSATGSDPGASIEAGRYIAKRVYLEAKQSTSGVTQLQADIDISKHVKLQTRLGNGSTSAQATTPENDPGSSIGLFYQFEY